MKGYTAYLSGIIAVISLFIAVSEWRTINFNSQILATIAVLASISLTYVLYNYWKQKNRTIPHLIHLKGLCAVTHELRDLVSKVPSGTLKNEPIWTIIKSLITSAHGRATALAAGDPDLKSVCDELTECLTNECSEEVIRRNTLSVYKHVDDTDVKYLREAGVAYIVYPGPHN